MSERKGTVSDKNTEAERDEMLDVMALMIATKDACSPTGMDDMEADQRLCIERGRVGHCLCRAVAGYALDGLERAGYRVVRI